MSRPVLTAPEAVAVAADLGERFANGASERAADRVLDVIGGTTVRGDYVRDSRHADPAVHADWLDQVRPVFKTLAQAGALA